MRNCSVLRSACDEAMRAGYTSKRAPIRQEAQDSLRQALASRAVDFRITAARTLEGVAYVGSSNCNWSGDDGSLSFPNSTANRVPDAMRYRAPLRNDAACPMSTPVYRHGQTLTNRPGSQFTHLFCETRARICRMRMPGLSGARVTFVAPNHRSRTARHTPCVV